MRGTHGCQTGRGAVLGIIPAYAGNTLLSCFAIWQARDHPRVCGEHSHILRWKDATMGSSPRMRGTPSPRLFHDGDTGIIPAYAGNT